MHHVIIHTRAYKRFSRSTVVRDTSFYVGAGRFTTFGGLGKRDVSFIGQTVNFSFDSAISISSVRCGGGEFHEITVWHVSVMVKSASALGKEAARRN